MGAGPTGAAGGALSGTYPNPDLAPGVAGAGPALASNVPSVNVDGSTPEINSDTPRVKDGGVTAAGAGDGRARLAGGGRGAGKALAGLLGPRAPLRDEVERADDDDCQADDCDPVHGRSSFRPSKRLIW